MPGGAEEANKKYTTKKSTICGLSFYDNVDDARFVSIVLLRSFLYNRDSQAGELRYLL